jgi:hypothetical protein
MASEKIDLYIDQGSDFYQSVYLTDQYKSPINLTGYDFSAQIREIPSGDVIAQFQPVTENAVGGHLTIAIPASITGIIPVTTEFNFYRYDLFMKNNTNGSILMLFHGDIFVNDRITQFS